MRLTIVGAGAIGTVLGLALGPHCELSVLARPGRRAEQLAAQGLCVYERGMRKRTPVRVAVSAAELPSADVVVLAVKSYDTLHALADAAPLLCETGVLLCLQNGLGNVERAVERFGAGRVLYGGTSQGAYLDPQGAVHRMGEGRWRLAALESNARNSAQELVALFTKAGLLAELVDDWRRAAWEKAAINAVINPLTALLDAENERVLAPDLSPFVYALCQETAQVLRLEGLAQSASQLVAAVRDTAARTAHNRSSMRADFVSGRPLELDAINGEILRRAQAAGLVLPYHSFLVELLCERAQARTDR